MRDFVLAVERAYVAAATTRGPVDDFEHAFDALDTPGDAQSAAAAIGAVSSHYLAVGTPRSIGLIGSPEASRASLEAHATWFAPRDIRVVEPCGIAGERLVSIDEALACDIVCIHRAIAIEARQIRRGTHLNVLIDGVTLPADLVAQISREVPDLGAMAAGLVDGRQLDEITIFVIGDAAIARATTVPGAPRTPDPSR